MTFPTRLCVIAGWRTRTSSTSNSVGIRPLIADALAPADGGREASGVAAGEPGRGDPDGSNEAVRPRPCCDRHHGAAEGSDVPVRRQAAEPGARAAGALG